MRRGLTREGDAVKTIPMPCRFSDFRPLPLLGNPHIQTLLGHLLPGPEVRLPTRRHILRLPDGDGLVLHDTMPPAWQPGGPIAVLVHGLTGSHAPSTMRCLALYPLDHGPRVGPLHQR